MEQENAIRIVNLHKTFKVPHDKNTTLKGALLNLFKKKLYTKMLAADGINFTVKRGEFLGIIGRNGSGKSTMLKMLAGIYLPDSGRIEINGKLSPFLEVGVGFNPELSGRENVYLSGTILGLTKKEIDGKFDEIVEFAEMSEFMDQKVKNYSSGMQVRLAFSVAIQAHSEILLIDEVLAVGDSNFQNKCNRVFHKLKKQGKTIVFVTHSMGAVQEFCDRVILLHKGVIYKEGKPKDVISEYEKLNFETQGDSDDTIRWGSGEARIADIKYLIKGADAGGKIPFSKPFTLSLTIQNIEKRELGVNLAVEIYTMDGTKCFGAVTNNGLKDKIPLKPGEKREISLKIDNNSLLPGEYYIDYRLFGDEFSDIINASSYASRFIISGKSDVSGVMTLGHVWEI